MATMILFTVTLWGGTLRDETKNGCVADYGHTSPIECVTKLHVTLHESGQKVKEGIPWITCVIRMGTSFPVEEEGAIHEII